MEIGAWMRRGGGRARPACPDIAATGWQGSAGISDIAATGSTGPAGTSRHRRNGVAGLGRHVPASPRRGWQSPDHHVPTSHCMGSRWFDGMSRHRANGGRGRLGFTAVWRPGGSKEHDDRLDVRRPSRPGAPRKRPAPTASAPVGSQPVATSRVAVLAPSGGRLRPSATSTAVKDQDAALGVGKEAVRIEVRVDLEKGVAARFGRFETQSSFT